MVPLRPGLLIWKCPPLTYPADKDIMLTWLQDRILEVVVNIDAPDDPSEMSWIDIRKHLTEQIKIRLDQIAVETQLSQITAYHRAVGIYVTNMCR